MPQNGAVWAQIRTRCVSILLARVNTAIITKKINISVKMMIYIIGKENEK